MIRRKEVTYSCDLCGKMGILEEKNLYIIEPVYENDDNNVAYTTLCESCKSKLINDDPVFGNYGKRLTHSELFDILTNPGLDLDGKK